MIYTKCKICSGETFEFLPQFELLQCKNCGFIFYKYNLDETKTKELYDKLYNYREDYSIYKQQAKILINGEQPHLGYNRLKVLNIILRKGSKRFIEIGAGVGVTGNYLQKKNKEYTGIELDYQASKLANEAGIYVKNASFELLEKYNDKDAVIAFEVIEHIDDLKHCLELIYNSIKTKGYLGFTIPNFDRFYNAGPELQKKKLGQSGPPVHVNFFTIASTEKMLSYFGFKVVYLRVRFFPDIHLNKRSTYQKLWRVINGTYHGPTILCVAQKN